MAAGVAGGAEEAAWKEEDRTASELYLRKARSSHALVNCRPSMPFSASSRTGCLHMVEARTIRETVGETTRVLLLVRLQECYCW